MVLLHIAVALQSTRNGSLERERQRNMQLAVVRQDEWREEGTHVCLHKCSCPPDGSPCTIAPACDDSSFACRPGYKRFSSGEARCYMEGCAQGTLQVRGLLFL